jgi:hypothetical protein
MMIGRDGEFSTLMGVYEQEEATLANDYPLYVAIHPDQVTKIYGRVHVRVTFAFAFAFMLTLTFTPTLTLTLKPLPSPLDRRAISTGVLPEHGKSPMRSGTSARIAVSL